MTADYDMSEQREWLRDLIMQLHYEETHDHAVYEIARHSLKIAHIADELFERIEEAKEGL